MKLRVLPLIVFFIFSCGANAEEINIGNIMLALGPFLEGKPANTRCKEYLARANEINGITLLYAFAHCSREASLVEAAFLLNASNIRLSVEQEYFVPAPSETASMSMLNGVRRLYTTHVGKDEVFRDEQLYKALIAMIKSWKPTVSSSFSPGWATSAEPPPAVVIDRIEKAKDTTLVLLDEWAFLLQDDEFFRAKIDMEKFMKLHPTYKAGSEIEKEFVRLKNAFDNKLIQLRAKRSVPNP